MQDDPVLDTFPELVALDKHDCMDDAVSHTIVNLEAFGKTQYTDFVNAVIKTEQLRLAIPLIDP